MLVSIVSLIFNQTTPCSNLEWLDEYRSEHLISSIVKRSHDVTSALVVEKIGWFFMELCFESEQGRKLASTNDAYQLLVKKCCSLNLTPQSAYRISRAICRIVFNNPDGQDLFATTETVAAIDKMAEKATTPESTRWVASAICNITFDNIECQQVFATNPAMVAIVNTLAKNSNTVESAEWVARSLCSLTELNIKSQRLFCTVKTVDAINKLAKCATTSESVAWIGSAIINLTKDHATAQRLFCGPETVFAVTRLAKFATATDSVELVAAAAAHITSVEEAQILFATPEVVTAVVALAKYAKSPECVRGVAAIIGNVSANNAFGQQLFSTQDLVAVITTLAAGATTAESAESIARAISSITLNNTEGKRLFSNPATISAIHALVRTTATAEGARWIATAICNISSSVPKGQRLFSTPESVVAIVALAELATTPESATWVASAICNITFSNPEAKRLFTSSEIVEAINSIALRCTSPESAELIATAIYNLTSNNNVEAKLLFSTPETVSVFVALIDIGQATPDAVTWISNAILNVILDNSRGLVRFGTPKFAEQFKKMENAAQVSPSAKTAFVSCYDAIKKVLPREEEIIIVLPPSAENKENQDQQEPPTSSSPSKEIENHNHEETQQKQRSRSSSSSTSSSSTSSLPPLESLSFSRPSPAEQQQQQQQQSQQKKQLIEEMKPQIHQQTPPLAPQDEHQLDSRHIELKAHILQLSARHNCPVSVSSEAMLTLVRNEITESNFLDLTENDLKELGIPLGSRKAVLEIIRLESLSMLASSSSALSSTVSSSSPGSSAMTLAAAQLLDRLRNEFPVYFVFSPSDIHYDFFSASLGSGSFGTVRRASIIPRGNKPCAAKVFMHQNIEPGIKEALHCIGINHDHITEFYGVTVTNEPMPAVVILLALATSDFHRFFASLPDPQIDSALIRRFATHIASGLTYLHCETQHKKRMIHGDLKPANILVFGAENTLKLVDFGGMVEMKGDATHTQRTGLMITRSFTPPELLFNSETGKHIVAPTVDVFAFGVILLRMIARKAYYFASTRGDDSSKEIHKQQHDDGDDDDAAESERQNHSFHGEGICLQERIAQTVRDVISGNVHPMDFDEEKCCIERNRIVCDSDEVAANGQDLIDLCVRCLMVNPKHRPKDGSELLKSLSSELFAKYLSNSSSHQMEAGSGSSGSSSSPEGAGSNSSSALVAGTFETSYQVCCGNIINNNNNNNNLDGTAADSEKNGDRVQQ